MAEQQTIKYSPQWTDMTVDNVLGENYSSTEQVNSIQQLLAYSLITRTEVDIGEILYNDLDPFKVIDIELTAHMITVNNQRDSVSPPPLVAKPKKEKSQTAWLKPRHILMGHVGNKPPADMEPLHTTNANLSRTGAKYQENQTQSSRLRYQSLTKNKGEPSYEGEPDTQPMVLTYADVRDILLSEDEAQESDEEVLAAGDDTYEDPQDDKKSENSIPKARSACTEQHEEASVSYVDLKALVDQYYDENIAHRDQSDKLVEAFMSSLDRSSTTISNLYKSLNVITQLLKEISNTVKDNPTTNQKINEATKTFARISSHVTEVELSHTSLKREISSLRQDTSEIKSMMTKMYVAFQGENATITATEEPPSHTEGETKEPRLAIPILSITSTIIPPTQPITTIIIHPKSSQAAPKIDKGKRIATESEDDPSKKTEEQIKKAEEEVRLNAISKTKVIKVVREEAKKLGIDPKEVISTKAGELFKKAQDAEHEVFKRQHTEKKHMELELETRIPGLECSRTLPKNVSFVNNMVIEEPKYGIFFTDEFGDQAFLRWSDIDKVGMEALMSYLVAASMVKSPENARFNMKLRNLIAEHPDQEKLKSKKVKLEALGYNID
nr:hypothetical protein [Tanacetum cinerariifolium]